MVSLDNKNICCSWLCAKNEMGNDQTREIGHLPSIQPGKILRERWQQMMLFIYFLKNILFIIFRERGRESEREGEKHQCVVAYHAPHTGDLASNPSMCGESDPWLFALQAGTPPTEPPGQMMLFKETLIFKILCCFLRVSFFFFLSFRSQTFLQLKTQLSHRNTV